MVLYILGAGASYGSFERVQPFPTEVRVSGVSVVQYIPKEIRGLKKFLKSIGDYFYKILSTDDHGGLIELSIRPGEYINKAIDDIEWVFTEISTQPSIDTLAKKLMLRGEIDNYKKLNNVIQLFILWQEFAYNVDNRYDGLLATLINKRGDFTELDKRVHFVTWNYDVQIQRSAISFINSKGNLSDSVQIIREIDLDSPHYNHDGINFIRLNGSIALDTYNKGMNTRKNPYTNLVKYKPFNEDDQEFIKCMLGQVYEIYKDTENKYNPAILYSWEKDNAINSKNLEVLYSRIEKYDDVVVIGYSFPAVNRNIDRELFQKFRGGANFYVQNTSASIHDAVGSLASLLTVKKEIRPITNLAQFFIPPSI